MARVIVGDDARGWEAFQSLFPEGMTYREHKRRLLLAFGVPRELVVRWEQVRKSTHGLGKPMRQLLGTMLSGMERMCPTGVTQLGLYVASIGDVVAQRGSGRTILDFGCGAWVDASQYLASRMERPMVRLVDVRPLPLYFSAYMLHRIGIAHEAVLSQQRDDASLLVTPETALIVESTAFEHVRNIRHLFPKMVEALPPGGLFLTNYTRLDWSDPVYDGHQDNKDFAASAVALAQEMAYRYEWQPDQGYWDLWERK